MTLSIIQLCDFAHVSVTCRTRVYSVNSESEKKMPENMEIVTNSISVRAGGRAWTPLLMAFLNLDDNAPAIGDSTHATAILAVLWIYMR